ncbi:MAG: hypothetical protein EBZ95_14240 [Chitinophagia bacterium]|nr:hypothetical protein [Chitinophagia bacterium]
MILWESGWKLPLKSIKENIYDMGIHRNVIVSKPWGYEYLVYETTDVALWLLYIKDGGRTSLHCHPNKTTGLLLLKGDARISFIADFKDVSAPSKQMFRRGLFHSTEALSNDGIFLLEIETPNNKNDLIRLNDIYGRSNLSYESGDNLISKTKNTIWITEPISAEPEIYDNGEISFRIQRINKLETLLSFHDDQIVMFLRGGVGKIVSGIPQLATAPGDIGLISILKKVIVSMEFVSEDTLVLIAGNNEA